MKMRTVSTLCPYCGTQAIFGINANEEGPIYRVLRCSPTAIGCEETFVVKVDVTVGVWRYKLQAHDPECGGHDEELYRDYRDEVEGAARP